MILLKYNKLPKQSNENLRMISYSSLVLFLFRSLSLRLRFNYDGGISFSWRDSHRGK